LCFDTLLYAYSDTKPMAGIPKSFFLNFPERRVRYVELTRVQFPSAPDGRVNDCLCTLAELRLMSLSDNASSICFGERKLDYTIEVDS